MRWDFFHRPESNRRDPAENQCKVYIFDLPEDMELADALEHAYEAGMPRGSARAGCVEIQTDRGIYSHVNDKRIDVSTPRRAKNVVFKTWEQLEQEES